MRHLWNHNLCCFAVGITGRERWFDLASLLLNLTRPHSGAHTFDSEPARLHRDLHDLPTFLLGEKEHASLAHEEPGGP